MAYTPPIGDAVDFNAIGGTYTPPAGNDVNFDWSALLPEGFGIVCWSVVSFIGGTAKEARDFVILCGTDLSVQASRVNFVLSDAWANPWSATGTSIDWRSRTETPRDFSCATSSSVSWNARFQYVSELISSAATAIDWRSSFSVVPHNVLKQGSIDLSLKSAVAWKSSFAAPAEFIRDNASKTTLAFVAGFEKPSSFSMKPWSIASWKGRFHYPSTFSIPPATSIVWRSSSSGYSNPCCMQPVACRIPVYATAARFVVTCKSRLCLRS